MGLFSYRSVLPCFGVRVLWGAMRLLALLLIVLGLSEPYIFLPSKVNKHTDVRLFFVLDVSRSMQYAEDVLPNRLVAVRNEVCKFMSKLDGIYETSIIPFAGMANPYYCPPTFSSTVYLPLMQLASPDCAPSLGTDIFAALEALQEVIKHVPDGPRNVVFLITDGGKEEADATNRIKTDQLLITLRDKKNVFINTIGVGGKEPCMLRIRNQKGAFIDFVRDDNGAVAKSHLDESILDHIAKVANGKYFHFDSDTADLSSFLDEILQQNRVVAKGELVYKKVSLQPWLFMSAAVFIWFCFLANRSGGCDGRQEIDGVGKGNSRRIS